MIFDPQKNLIMYSIIHICTAVSLILPFFMLCLLYSPAIDFVSQHIISISIFSA
jgi:hypothetical protein